MASKKIVNLFEEILNLERDVNNSLVVNSSKVLSDIEPSIRSLFSKKMLESKHRRQPTVTQIVSLQRSKSILESNEVLGLVFRVGNDQVAGILSTGEVKINRTFKEALSSKNLLESVEKYSKTNNLEVEVLVIS